MPTDSNETSNIDELLAELKNEKVEESIPSKKDKNPFKDKKNDEGNTYEYQENTAENDLDW